MKYKTILIIIPTLLLSYCVGVSVIPLGDEKLSPTDETKEIILFPNRSSINRPYKEIAILRAYTSDGDFIYDEDMLYYIKSKARSIGADAVVYEELTERNGGGYFIGNTFFQDSHKSFRVTAIRFTEIDSMYEGADHPKLIDDRVPSKQSYKIQKISGKYILIYLNNTNYTVGDKLGIYRDESKIGYAEFKKFSAGKAVLQSFAEDGFEILTSDVLKSM